MQVLSIQNQELLASLTDFSQWLFKQPLDNDFAFIDNSKSIKHHPNPNYPTSEAYLTQCLPHPLSQHGFPEFARGFEILHDRAATPNRNYFMKAQELNEELMNFFGARNNALQMIYPPNGYIGWHHNGNAPGYNIILTCSETGAGEFESYDIVSNKITQYKDSRNRTWTAKAGYFGDMNKEPEKVYWHCARTRCWRTTFSYVIYNKDIWDNMIEDIETAT